MSEGAWAVVAIFCYVVVGTITFRVVGARHKHPMDHPAPTFAGIFWPVAIAVGVGWLLGEIPVAVATRFAEGRTLRDAERARRIREAEEILRREGLDLNP